MESIRIPYKQDSFGNDIFARIAWSKNDNAEVKPIVLIFHGGGLMVGSSEIIPKTQIEHLAQQGFVVVIPNYRLAPQVTAQQAFADCEESYDWATTTLPEFLQTKHGVQLDSKRVVAMGHSSGGSIALHLASRKPLKAISAFYPSLFNADPSTSAHKPTAAPPFGAFPDYTPSAADWDLIAPAQQEVSEAALALPGSVPAPRNKWQMHTLKHGRWLPTVQPDGDYAVLDAMTRLSADWPPVMLVQGEADDVPGSDLELARRAEREMKAAGVREVRLEIVPGAGHMFDLPPTVGTSDLGEKWQAVLRGLDWLREHV